MTRHWRDKGDDAKRYHLTIAVSIRLVERLRAYAARLGLPYTLVAHDMIEKGLPVEERSQTERVG